MPTAPKRKAEHLRATKEVVERAKREILWDVQNGTLPALVQCFSDLHDFADANAYGGGNDESANSRFWKKVHEQLGAWMKTGGLGRSVSEPSRAVRAQRALEYYKTDSGGHGPIDCNTIRDLMQDTLHWLAQQPPPNDYPDPAETLSVAAHMAIVDFPEGREALAAIEAAALNPKRKSKTKRTPKEHEPAAR
jgi:hypothetical protein